MNLEEHQNKPESVNHAIFEEYMGQLTKKIARGSGIIFIGMAIGSFLGFLTRIIIARFWGPSDYGLFNIAFSTLMIFQIIAMVGFRASGARFVAYYNALNKKEEIKGTLVSGIKILIPLSITLSILLLAFSKKIAIIYSEPELTPHLQYFSLALPVIVLFFYICAILRGFGDMEYLIYSREFINKGSTFLLILTFVFLRVNIIYVTYSFIMGFIFGTILAIYYLFKKHSFLKRVKSAPLGKKLLIFSLPLTLSFYLDIFRRGSDNLLIGYFMESSSVGIYNASFTIAQMMLNLLTPVATVALPVITGLYACNRIEELKVVYSNILRWILYISFPLFLLIFIYPTDFITVLFGQVYSNGANVLQILVVGFISSLFVGPLAALINSIGKTKFFMAMSGISSLSNLALDLVLIPPLGIVGAAIATSISVILFNITGLYLVFRTLKVNFFNKIHILYPTFISIALLLLHIFSNKTMIYLEVPPLILLLGKMVILYTISVFVIFKLIGLSSEEEKLMSSIKGKVIRKISQEK